MNVFCTSGSVLKYASCYGQVRYVSGDEMAEGEDGTTFQSTLEIQNAIHQVKLTTTHIFWENTYNKTPSDNAVSEPLFRKLVVLFVNKLRPSICLQCS